MNSIFSDFPGFFFSWGFWRPVTGGSIPAATAWWFLSRPGVPTRPRGSTFHGGSLAAFAAVPGPRMLWDTRQPILQELGQSPNGVCAARRANPPDGSEPVSCHLPTGALARGPRGLLEVTINRQGDSGELQVNVDGVPEKIAITSPVKIPPDQSTAVLELHLATRTFSLDGALAS
jgi:hypothetical protein